MHMQEYRQRKVFLHRYILMNIVFIFVVAAHALIHLIGFAKGLLLADVPQLKQPVSSFEGILWLLASVILLVSASVFSFSNKWFWILGSAGLVLSQCLIVHHWGEAKYGTVVNIVMLLPVIIAFAKTLPSDYYNIYKAEVSTRLAQAQDTPLLTEADMAHLPAPVQKYIRYTGSVGKPQVRNFRAVFKGEIRRKMSGGFMKMEALQHSFFDRRARIFYITSKMWGIPFAGLHLYTDSSATMRVRVASLLRVADAKGAQMTKGETVTMFNDMCIIAPATLVSRDIEWELVDPLTVKARFTNAGYTVSAMLYFNAAGALVNFSSDDRYLSEDGSSYINYRWTTPVSDYIEFRGRKIASYGEATWHTPEGEFCYGKFRTVDVEYNL